MVVVVFVYKQMFIKDVTKNIQTSYLRIYSYTVAVKTGCHPPYFASDDLPYVYWSVVLMRSKIDQYGPDQAEDS